MKWQTVHTAETADPDDRYGARDGGAAAVTSSQTEDGVTSRTEHDSGLSGPADRESEYAELVQEHQRSLLGLAHLLTGNHHDAEDLVQAVLVKAYFKWRKVRAAEHRLGYLRRMMVNEHSSLWRRAWKRRERSVDELPERPSGAEVYDLDDATWRQVLALPPRQRAAVALRYYDDLSEKETAEILGCSVGTVKSQTSRALATLRTALSAEREEEI